MSESLLEELERRGIVIGSRIGGKLIADSAEALVDGRFGKGVFQRWFLRCFFILSLIHI